MSDATPGNLERELRALTDGDDRPTPPARPGSPLLEVKAELLHVNARLDQQHEDLKYLKAAIDLLLRAEGLERPEL